MKKPNKLWEVGWVAHYENHQDALYENHQDALYILANSAEIAACKAKKFLHKQGSTSIQIKSVLQKGTIDVF